MRLINRILGFPNPEDIPPNFHRESWGPDYLVSEIEEAQKLVEVAPNESSRNSAQELLDHYERLKSDAESYTNLSDRERHPSLFPSKLRVGVGIAGIVAVLGVLITALYAVTHPQEVQQILDSIPPKPTPSGLHPSNLEVTALATMYYAKDKLDQIVYKN